VKLARSADEAAELASHILGMTLVTPQTGPQGRVVRRFLIEEGLDIKRELYLGLLIDRETGRRVFMAAPRAAWKIEEVAKDIPTPFCANTFTQPLACSLIQARKICVWSGPFGRAGNGGNAVPTGAFIARSLIRMLRCWKLIRAS